MTNKYRYDVYAKYYITGDFGDIITSWLGSFDNSDDAVDFVLTDPSSEQTEYRRFDAVRYIIRKMKHDDEMGWMWCAITLEKWKEDEENG